ncbi:MAG: Mrp/NBP35 family ATP-binding protein [Prevotellaceae bacterium]|jgi:ATP-binding protein involved in chromosome partitioning|nr:Mrp/NBP35 family ATP-binding protein [Prevotellaceae bacterium]
MTTLYPQLILDALTHVRYPGTGKDLVSSGMVGDDIRIDGRQVSLSILFEKPNDPFAQSVIKASEQAILTYVGQDIDIKGRIKMQSKALPPPKTEEALTGVKHIIAIFSGKGGVGKSTVSANLAVALANAGSKVGLLDADIHGPSIPKMFGVEDARPRTNDNKDKLQIEPVEQFGVKLLSIGFFVDPSDALIWRGGMASNALKQLITEADWGKLDYLLIDMPPGTSDIHLTLVQTVAITGIIIVTTPQEVALADARKGFGMFTNRKINVPVLGLVENMSWFTPAEHPENKYYLFGKGGGIRLAQELQIPLLGQIPLIQSIREHSDAGTPVVLEHNSLSALAFTKLAEQISLAISD